MASYDKEIISFASVSNDFTLENCHCEIFPDFKHCLFYNANTMVVVELYTKAITFKVSFPKEMIHKIKILDEASISYVRKSNGVNQIISTNINCVDDYVELKLKDDIIDYLPFRQDNEGYNYMFVITNNYELILYKENIEVCRKRIELLSNVNIEDFTVIKMDFVKGYKTLIFLTSNGTIYTYQIVYSDMNQMSFLRRDISFISDQNDMSKYQLVNFHRKTILCNNNIQCDVNEDINEGIFVSIVLKRAINESVVATYQLDPSGAIFPLKNLYRKINIVDSYLINRKEKRSMNDIIDYLFFIVQESDAYVIYQTDFYDLIGLKKNNDSDADIVSCKKLRTEPNAVAKVLFSGVEINLYKKDEYSFNFNLLFLRILNEIECYFTETSIEKFPKYKEIDAQMIHIKKGLTTDVNKYIEFYAQNQYDHSMMKEYKDAVNGIISKDFAINIDSEELDPYLLFLINNNSFFAIKKYIGIRDCTNYNKFLVSNDILNKTCLVLFEGIKNTYIAQGFSESLFKSRKVFEYLTNVLEVMKTVRNRNLNPNRQPFHLEEKIISEDAVYINNRIYDIEIFIFLLKVMYAFYESGIEEKEVSYYKKGIMFKIFSLYSEEEIDELMKKGKVFINRLIQIYNLVKENEKIAQIDMINLLSYSKFLIFIHLYAFQCAHTNNNECIIKLYRGMKKEYNEYRQICDALMNINDSTQVISEFLINLNTNLNCFDNKSQSEYLSALSQINFNFLSALYESDVNKSYHICKRLLNFFVSFNEWMIYVKILLRLDLINVAYEYMIQCYAKYYISTKEYSIEKVISSNDYVNIKLIYEYFFEYLITHEKIDILFALPLNYIEKYLLKEFLIEHKKYEQLLILYYIKAQNIEQAKGNFGHYVNSGTIAMNEATSQLYKNIIENIVNLFGEEKKGDVINKLRTDEHSLYIKNDVESEKHNSKMMAVKDVGRMNNVDLSKRIIFESFTEERKVSGNKKIDSIKNETNEMIQRIVQGKEQLK